MRFVNFLCLFSLFCVLIVLCLLCVSVAVTVFVFVFDYFVDVAWFWLLQFALIIAFDFSLGCFLVISFCLFVNLVVFVSLFVWIYWSFVFFFYCCRLLASLVFCVLALRVYCCFTFAWIMLVFVFWFCLVFDVVNFWLFLNSCIPFSFFGFGLFCCLRSFCLWLLCFDFLAIVGLRIYLICVSVVLVVGLCFDLLVALFFWWFWFVGFVNTLCVVWLVFVCSLVWLTCLCRFWIWLLYSECCFGDSTSVGFVF